MPAQASRARRSGQRGSARTVARSGSPSTSDAARNPASAARSSQVDGVVDVGRPWPSCTPPRRPSAPCSGGWRRRRPAHLGRLGEAVGVVEVGLERAGALAALAVGPLDQPARHGGGGAGAGQHLGGDEVRRAARARRRRRPRRAGTPACHRSARAVAALRYGSAPGPRPVGEALGGGDVALLRSAAHARCCARAGSWVAHRRARRRRCDRRRGWPGCAAPTAGRPGRDRALDVEGVDVGARLRGADLLEVVEGEEQDEERRRSSGR